MPTAMAMTETAGSHARARRRGGSGPDRLTVALLALAGFLAVLALLAGQLKAGAANVRARPVVVLRRVYETTVIETILGSRPGGGSSVTRSVSSSGSSYTSGPAPRTRAS
jgi:hypothetical protein